MNKQRRTRIFEARSALLSVCEDIKQIADAEEDARDNMPESLQESDRYMRSEECSEALDNAIALVEEAADALKEAI